MNMATLILAAGGSTRLGGQPKQLLPYKGMTLIRYVAETALSLGAGPVIVVLGGNQVRIQAELADLAVQPVYNPDWQTGMASSLRAGLTALANTSAEAFLVLLTDQPFVTADLLQQVIDTRQRTRQPIVASRYGQAGPLGVPALFDMRYAAEFMRLSGDVGARKLIHLHAHACAEVAFPLATIDLDTPEDVKNWQSSLPLL